MVREGDDEVRNEAPMKAEARGGCNATNATNGNVVAWSFCAAVAAHKKTDDAGKK
jgi:hypothetical protein